MVVKTREGSSSAAGGSGAEATAGGSPEDLRRGRDVLLPVLLYHYVGPAAPDGLKPWTIRGGVFERHMAFLARRGYVGIRPSDWLAWLREGKLLPEKPVLVTFDDAYADLVSHALPVIERLGFGAAVFVVTGLVGGTNVWDERHGRASRQLMTADHIREWAARGIEFGAHSRTHARLPSLADAQLRDEIEGSREDLSRILGRTAEAFAYPYGMVDERVGEAVRKSFGMAFTTAPGLNSCETDPHLLRRNDVTSADSALDVACRVKLGWCPTERLRSRIRVAGSRIKRALLRAGGSRQPRGPAGF